MEKRVNPLELNTSGKSYQPNENVGESVAVTNAEEVITTKSNSSVKWYVKAWTSVKNAFIVAWKATKKAFIIAGVATGKFFVKLYKTVKNFFVNLFKKSKDKDSKEKTVENKESK